MMPAQEPRPLLLRSWFWWPLALRLLAWLLLAHVYDMVVFQDVSWQMVSGRGAYAQFSGWLAAYGDGYYAYPPLYAYMLWVSGLLSDLLGGHWWLHQVLIKTWLVVADLVVVGVLYRLRPDLGRAYWTLWFVPLVGIAQVQPDLWVGLSVLAGLLLARRGRWMATGLALAGGIAMKFTPLLILPFLVQYLILRGKWKATLQLLAATALGFVIVWLPYVVAFDDLASFTRAVMFHLQRPAAGLTVVSGLQRLLEAGLVVVGFINPALATGGMISVGFQRVELAYPLVTLGVFLTLAVVARTRRWSLEQIFCVPLLAFLLANKVVHEHYMLHVLPVLLVAFPEAIRQLVGPYSVYLVAAGTPLRFFPQEYGLPLTPDALVPPSLQASLGVLIALGFVIATGIAAVLLSWRLFQLTRGLVGVRPAAPLRGKQQSALAVEGA